MRLQRRPRPGRKCIVGVFTGRTHGTRVVAENVVLSSWGGGLTLLNMRGHFTAGKREEKEGRGKDRDRRDGRTPTPQEINF